MDFSEYGHDYYVVIADGGKRSDITYGSYKVYDPYGEEIYKKQLVFGYGTNNTAEYAIILHALRYCLSEGLDNVVLLTDSALVVNQVSGAFAINYSHLQELADAVNEELPKFNKVILEKVPRNIIYMALGH